MFLLQAVWNSAFIDPVWLLWLDLWWGNCGTIKCFEPIYNIRLEINGNDCELTGK